MRLLLLTETPPFPLNSGGRIKTHHTIAMLARRAEVHCHTLTRDEPGQIPASLRATAASVTLHRIRRGPAAEVRAAGRALRRRLPVTVARQYSPPAAAAIADAARRLAPTAIYCDHLAMLPYAWHLDYPIIYDAHNVEWLLVRRYAAHSRMSLLRPLMEAEWRTLRRFETAACRRADLVLAVSPVDRDALAALGAARIAVVPVAWDVEATPRVEVTTDAPRLLFVGGLHWPPNADAVDQFVRAVLPLVRRSVPAAELVVVGRTDARVAAHLRHVPGLVLAGAVDDVTPWFESSRALVVPLRSASGTRVKILEAFARGLPVISTAVGCEGLEVTPGVHLLAAETPTAFAATVVDLLRNRGRAASLARAARQYVETHHAPARVAERLDRALEMLGLAPASATP